MSVSSSQFPLVPYRFANETDINLALQIPEVANEVKKLERNFRSIDVRVTMSNLDQVGKLLQLAYAGSKGHKCSEKIIGFWLIINL